MNWRRDPRLAYALVNLCTLFWATNFALGRLLRDDIGPFTLTAARFTVAAVVFTALLLRRPAGERRPGREWPLLLGMGVTGVFGFGSLLYTGLRTTTATNASLINGTGPLVIGILAALTLHERFGRRQAIGAVISLAGVALVVSGGSLAALTHLRLNTGDLLVLAAVLAWGVYSVLSRVVTRTRIGADRYGGVHLVRPAAAVVSRGAGMADATADAQPHDAAGRHLHRCLRFGRGLPGLERRGAPGGAGQSDGVLQHAAGLRHAAGRLLSE